MGAASSMHNAESVNHAAAPVALLMDKMQINPTYCGCELGKTVQPCLPLLPVVLLQPVLCELLVEDASSGGLSRRQRKPHKVASQPNTLNTIYYCRMEIQQSYSYICCILSHLVSNEVHICFHLQTLCTTLPTLPRFEVKQH